MSVKFRNGGFSLTEVLMASGILAIGLMLVAGTFPVGLKLTCTATERTISPIVANEAFAKIQLYGVDFGSANWPGGVPGAPHTDFVNFADVYDDQGGTFTLGDDHFAYPSTDTLEDKRYSWSALCRYNGGTDVQVTVFVSRKGGAGEMYPDPGNPDVPWAKPISIATEEANDGVVEYDKLQFVDEAYEGFINADSTIVDGATGEIYRVMERIVRDLPDKDWIRLDREWVDIPGSVWVVPPSVGGRYPCVEISQETITF